MIDADVDRALHSFQNAFKDLCISFFHAEELQDLCRESPALFADREKVKLVSEMTILTADAKSKRLFRMVAKGTLAVRDIPVEKLVQLSIAFQLSPDYKPV